LEDKPVRKTKVTFHNNRKFRNVIGVV